MSEFSDNELVVTGTPKRGGWGHLPPAMEGVLAWVMYATDEWYTLRRFGTEDVFVINGVYLRRPRPKYASDSEPTKQVIDRSFSATETRVTSESGGAKGTKPARYDQIPSVPLRLIAEKFGKGNAKYEPGENGLDNWRNGYEFSKSFAALQRHAWAFWSGEDFDPDSDGETHLAAVAWHAMVMLEWLSRPEIAAKYDDRQDPKSPLEVSS